MELVPPMSHAWSSTPSPPIVCRRLTSPSELRTLATLVGSQVVRRPLPPPPPVKEGLPPIPLPPPGPGVDQGEVIALREVLSAETRAAVMLPEPPGTQAASLEAALIAPADGGAPQRYYYAVSVTPRGRYGPPTALVPVPLGPTSSAPSQPTITVEEQSATIRWKPSGDVRGAACADAGGLAGIAANPSRPAPDNL